MLLFYTPWKHQKTFGFLVFSGGINGNIGQTWEKNIHTCKILLLLKFWKILKQISKTDLFIKNELYQRVLWRIVPNF